MMYLKYRIRRWRSRLLTFVLRVADPLAKHTPIYKRAKDELWRRASKIDALTRENAVLGERIQLITEKISHVSVQRPPNRFQRFRVVVEVDQMAIEQGFLHGNDADVIEHMGHYIGRAASREIHRANFARWET